MDLVLQVEAGEVSAFIFGATRQPTPVRLPARVEFLGVRFRPWIGAPLFGLQGRELLGRTIDLQERCPRLNHSIVDGCERQEVHARLMRAANERLMARSLSPAQHFVKEACELFAREPLGLGMSVFSRRLGVSERSLHRAFDGVTGSGPKATQRTIRWRNAVSRLRAGQPPVELALACGFADQPHLTHELRRMVGTTPAAISRELARPGSGAIV